jgi:hypothetical protein
VPFVTNIFLKPRRDVRAVNRFAIYFAIALFSFSLVTLPSLAWSQDPDANAAPESAPTASESTSEADSSETKTEAKPPEDANTWAAPEELPMPRQRPKALEESGISSNVKKGGPTEDFTVPLLFPPEENGIKLTDPQIKWELTDGLKINIGGLKIDGSKIGARWTQVSRDSIPTGLQAKGRGGQPVQIFSFSWPQVMTKGGRLTIENEKEEVKWLNKIGDNVSTKWRDFVRRNSSKEWAQHANSTWGAFDANPNSYRFLKMGDTFRMCMSQTNSDSEQLKICSGQFKVSMSGTDIKFVPVAVTDAATVSIEGKPIGARGIVNFPSANDIDIKVSFANGAFVRIVSHPIALKMLDVVWSKDQHDILVTGRGRVPLGSPKLIRNPKTNFWSDVGLLAKRDPVWQIALPREAPTVRVLGAFNLPFTLLLKFPKLPKESERVYIREGASGGTYSSRPTYSGYSPSGVEVSSEEESATSETANHFTWLFSAPNLGGENKSRIRLVDTQDENRAWIARHTVFRAYPYEFSARLTGFGTTTFQPVFAGELAGQVWFESLGVTQNDLISRQRWGISYRYFRVLLPFNEGPGVNVTTLSVGNIDLRYSLKRGIWNRDEVYGFIGSGETVTINTTSSSGSSLLGGVGMFWARPMPDVFSSVFNLIPYFRYSKYVDTDFIYYPISLQSGVSLGPTFTLNFHGKVFWFPRVYGEAGFGFKQFKFQNSGQNQQASFTGGYATVGLGMIF